MNHNYKLLSRVRKSIACVLTRARPAPRDMAAFPRKPARVCLSLFRRTAYPHAAYPMSRPVLVHGFSRSGFCHGDAAVTPRANVLIDIGIIWLLPRACVFLLHAHTYVWPNFSRSLRTSLKQRFVMRLVTIIIELNSRYASRRSYNLYAMFLRNNTNIIWPKWFRV